MTTPLVPRLLLLPVFPNNPALRTYVLPFVLPSTVTPPLKELAVLPSVKFALPLPFALKLTAELNASAMSPLKMMPWPPLAPLDEKVRVLAPSPVIPKFSLKV